MMNKLIFVLLMVSASDAFAWEQCKKEIVTKKEVCTEKAHALAGAGIGWLILGPIGAGIGALAGSDPKKECHTEETRTCETEAPKKEEKQ